MLSLTGYLMVDFAYDYSFLPLTDFAINRLWFNGFLGLSIIIVGILIAVIRKR